MLRSVKGFAFFGLVFQNECPSQWWLKLSWWDSISPKFWHKKKTEQARAFEKFRINFWINKDFYEKINSTLEGHCRISSLERIYLFWRATPLTRNEDCGSCYWWTKLDCVKSDYCLTSDVAVYSKMKSKWR